MKGNKIYVDILAKIKNDILTKLSYQYFARAKI